MKGWLRGPKAAVLIAFATLAVGVQNYIFFTSQPGPVTAIADEDDGAASGSILLDEAPRLEVVKDAEVVAWLSTLPATERNPFLLLEESAGEGEIGGPPGLPKLTGTMVGTHRRVAWFEGWPYAEGDRIGELTLLRIFSQAVLVRRGSEEIRLALRRNPDLEGGELQ